MADNPELDFDFDGEKAMPKKTMPQSSENIAKYANKLEYFQNKEGITVSFSTRGCTVNEMKEGQSGVLQAIQEAVGTAGKNDFRIIKQAPLAPIPPGVSTPVSDEEWNKRFFYVTKIVPTRSNPQAMDQLVAELENKGIKKGQALSDTGKIVFSDTSPGGPAKG